MANNQVSPKTMKLVRRQIMCDFINKMISDLKINLKDAEDTGNKAVEDTGDKVFAVCQIILELTEAQIIYVDDDGDIGPKMDNWSE